MNKDPLRGLLLLTGLTMVYATLYPFQFGPRHSIILEWYWPTTEGNLLDVVLNLLFFAPFGLLWGWRFRGPHGVKAGLLVCFLLSATVESAQAYLPGRYSQARDVIMNTMGGYGGILLARLPLFDGEQLRGRLNRLLEWRAALLLTGVWLVSQLGPFIPNLQRGVVEYAIAVTKPMNEWGVAEVQQGALGFLLVYVWREAVSVRVMLQASLVVLPLVGLKILVAGRPGGLETVITVWAGLLVGLSLSTGRWWPKPVWVLGLGILLLGWRQLYPFGWAASEPQPFYWLPLLATFETPRAVAMTMLASECFQFWMLARLAMESFGRQGLWYLGGLALLLLASEYAQRWQVGQTAEITDVVVLLLAAWPGLGLLELPQGLKRVER